MSQKRKKYSCRLNIERDYKIFVQLWKWKMLSTAAIHQRFFSHTSPAVCYNRLKKLQKANYLDLIYVKQLNCFLWTVTPKSFSSIRHLLLPLEEEGYRSEHLNHDFWVTAVHLGEFLGGTPRGFRTFSEQQLRRVREEAFNNEIPKPSFHRPDGYWLYDDNHGRKKMVALEVELSQKNDTAFQKSLLFYNSSKKINAVIWITTSCTLSYRLLKKVKSTVRTREQSHYFYNLMEFRKNGWQTMSDCATGQSLSIQEVLQSDLIEKPIESSSKTMVNSMMNFRKYPLKTNDL